MKKQGKELVLEQSTNTHKINAQNVVSEDLGNGILQLEIEGDGIITHGEHGVIKTESKNVIKYVQQELNPVSKAMQNAFD
jgi:hypothetical protein